MRWSTRAVRGIEGLVPSLPEAVERTIAEAEAEVGDPARRAQSRRSASLTAIGVG